LLLVTARILFLFLLSTSFIILVTLGVVVLSFLFVIFARLPAWILPPLILRLFFLSFFTALLWLVHVTFESPYSPFFVIVVGDISVAPMTRSSMICGTIWVWLILT
jgi:hypothetical protein